ncbi:MAG: DNA polymerase I [Acidobacteriota bacterium]
MPRLYLIDASGHIFRAYHAIPELSNSKGLPTNATYGFTHMLRKLLRQEQPDYIGAAFDPPGPTFRHQAFAEYKKSRPEMPADLALQLPYVKRVCEAYCIPILELAGYEADDVIGTLAARARAEGIETVIVSEDKDLLQLVGDGVTMLAERNQRRVYDSEAVAKKYGVRPENIPDLLALMGDSVDDIPGVKGIGKIGARKILEHYGTLEKAIAHAEEISHKTYRQNLTTHADMARLSKQLATIHTDLPVELDLDALRIKEPDKQVARALFSELEFRSLLEEFTEQGGGDTAYTTLHSSEALEEALEQARQAGTVSVDLETTHAEPARAEIVGVSLSWKPGAGCYLPLAHTTLEAANAMGVEEALRQLRPLLTDGSTRIVGQNLKYDLEVLKRYGLDGVQVTFDTMLASYLIHPTRPSHGLDGLALDFLGIKMLGFKDIVPSKAATFADVPIDVATRYAAEDADIALRLADLFEPELEAQGLTELYRDLELPLMYVLADMELHGVRIDVDCLAAMGEKIGAELSRLRDGIYEIAGEDFNLNSPRQLAVVLFDPLGLPSRGRTAKTGRRSTRAEVLEGLAEEYPIARQIIEYRELAKLKSTYVDALPALVNPRTGRLHTSFNQTVAATGRLSSSDPNLQNIPIRSQIGRQIRRAFIPESGRLMLTADYSQIELRIMAHLSGDPRLREAFAEGADVHRATAAKIFEVDPAQVTDEQRDRAKVINFGIMYGMGPQRLAREFHISAKEARQFIDHYFDVYAEVKAFLETTIERAKKDGYVTTLLGRIRHLPELHSPQRAVRSFGERIAVNTPVQGTAADMIKRAMVRLHSRLQAEGLRAAMIIQVHDELVLEVPEGELDTVAGIVRHEMEEAIELDVPVEVKIGWGTNWMEAKP